MRRIHGITVTLIIKDVEERDPLRHPIYGEYPVDVENVLIGEPSTEDITSTTNLSGHKVHYKLAIPKTDTHDWKNNDVMLPPPWECRCRVVGIPTEGISENIPLDWNKKVLLERYE